MSKRGFTATAHTTGKRTSQDNRAVKEAFRYTPSRKLFKPALILLRQNITTTSLMYIVPGLLAVLGSRLVGTVHGVTDVTGRVVAGGLLLAIASVWLTLGLAASYYFQLRVIGGGRPGLLECYRSSLHYIPRLIGLAALLAVVVGLGFVAIIVPGAIALRRYFLAPYFLIDGDTGIREAMDRSAAASKPARKYIWSMLVLLLLTAGVGGAAQKLSPAYGGLIAIITTSLTLFVPALRYKEAALHQPAASGIVSDKTPAARRRNSSAQ